MKNYSLLRVLILALGIALTILLFSQKSGTATPQPFQPEGRYLLHSGEVPVVVNPRTAEVGRRPVILRIDTQTGKAWAPLSELRSEANSFARFEVFDSSLSEEGVLGFEYGYSVIAKPP